MRSLALVLGASLLVFGCSSSPGGNNGNGGSGGSGGGVGGGGGSGGSGGGNAGSGGSGGGGGSGGPTADMARGPDMAMVVDRDPTAHPPPIDIQGAGPNGALATPEVYTVVWVDPAGGGDDKMMGDQLNSFYTWMLASPYFTNWGSEYGVTGGTAKGVLVVPEAPPALIKESVGSGSGFYKVLQKYVGTTGWPAATDIKSNTVFTFFLDPKTVAEQPLPPPNPPADSCKAFGGYHISQSDFFGGGPTYTYIVVARCPNIPNGPTEWQQDTIAASHELAETVADPQANGNNSGDRSIIAGGGEVGDICIEENIVQMNGSTPYTVQRLWSEKAWQAGNVSPCVPADGPWFGAAIAGNDTSAGAAPYNIVVHVDNSGKGSADFTMQPFSYDNTITSMKFELVQSLMPMGIALTPNIARSATSGMWGTGAPGTTFKVHIDASGAQPGKTGILGFAVVGSGATQRVSNWWGSLEIVSP
jgi:hypothetical protein